MRFRLSGILRRRQVLPAVMAFALAFFGVMPSATAGLGACGVVQSIFVRSTLMQASSLGSTNKILVKNRTVDPDCKGQAVSTSQAGTPMGDPTPTYVEIGWYKVRHADGSVHLCEFEEAVVNGGSPNFLPGPCDSNTPLSYGQYAEFRVKHVGSGTDWDTWINYGSGFILKASFSSLGIDTGIAFGETEKKGDGTSMGEDQSNLQDFSQNAWQDWPNAACALDNAAAWDWNKLSSNSYIVDQTTHAC